VCYKCAQSHKQFIVLTGEPGPVGLSVVRFLTVFFLLVVGLTLVVNTSRPTN